MHINEIDTNTRIRLTSFGQTNALYRRRLLAVGMTRGVEVIIIRKAPLGCPLQIEVRGISITLRKEEAAFLEWELV